MCELVRVRAMRVDVWVKAVRVGVRMVVRDACGYIWVRLVRVWG